MWNSWWRGDLAQRPEAPPVTGPRNPIKMLFSHKPERQAVSPWSLGLCWDSHVTWRNVHVCGAGPCEENAERSCHIPGLRRCWAGLSVSSSPVLSPREERTPAADSPRPAGQSPSVTDQSWATCMFTFHQAQSDTRLLSGKSSNPEGFCQPALQPPGPPLQSCCTRMIPADIFWRRTNSNSKTITKRLHFLYCALVFFCDGLSKVTRRIQRIWCQIVGLEGVCGVGAGNNPPPIAYLIVLIRWQPGCYSASPSTPLPWQLVGFY